MDQGSFPLSDKKSNSSHTRIKKVLTGIEGLDEVLHGGLPRGRATMLIGGPGCGKTILGMEVLYYGARYDEEPGVYLSFEETEEDLISNFASLGFDLNDLVAKKKLAIRCNPEEGHMVVEAGEYTFDALRLQIEEAVAAVGAKRIVIDSLDALFSRFTDTVNMRAEVSRLLQFVKNMNLTLVVIGELERGSAHHFGVKEYVPDCVITLDHRVRDQLSVRRLRVMKYRGSSHGSDEYPFLIDENGFSVHPITSLRLDYSVGEERITTGVDSLDELMGGGFFAGSSVLVSGEAGSGKSSLGAAFAEATRSRGQRSLIFSFEESASQMIRNMRSIGIDLSPDKDDLIYIEAKRPTLYSLEQHLLSILRMVESVEPATVIVDPVTNFTNVGESIDVRAMLVRLIDILKVRGITSLFTSLVSPQESCFGSYSEVSSLMDSWIIMSNTLEGRKRRRTLEIVKSRGMQHSNDLLDLYVTSDGLSVSLPNELPSTSGGRADA